ncbi:MAG TPA: DUF4105 domain-containing protein, partial [Polyangiaceae bacterium]|nr:DUF4105 domain-containing protein [Polyangiaceae bacterium]
RVLKLAQQKQLPASGAWQRLLHYHAGLFDEGSEVDGEAFFLSPAGKDDAAAELAATLRAFFMPAVQGREDAHAICRFPARFAFLDERLDLRQHLQVPRCPKLSRFIERNSGTSLAVVYAANALEYPASAFGHTFLYLKQARRPALGLGIDYQADTDTDNPLLYAFKGLTGLFEGRFRLLPVEEKLREYADEQDRDLWIYDLALSERELRRLVLHLWELSVTHFDYFYLTENCSYHVLGLIEAAAPRLDLIEHTKFAVLPIDTVKALFHSKGLVERVRYVPSRFSRLRASQQSEGRAELEPPVPWHKSPERGHGTMRFLFGAGAVSETEETFGTIGYRLALHDLLDPPAGQPELAQVQFMDTRVRYSLTSRTLTLNHLTFAELIALHPLSSWERRPSWRARAYGSRFRDGRCANENCFGHGVNGSFGATVATLEEDITAFVMADAFVLFSGGFAGVAGSFVSTGIGPHAGVRLRIGGRTVAMLSGTWSYLPGQRLNSTYEINGQLRSGLGKNLAVGIQSSVAPASIEAELHSYIYF